MHPMASGLIGEARRLDERGGRKRTRDVVVVTLVSPRKRCRSRRSEALNNRTAVTTVNAVASRMA